MNNIFLNQQDPLLNQYRTPPPYPQPVYMPQMPDKDWIQELDNILKDLTPQEIESLNGDSKWCELNSSLSSTIHEELVGLIRTRLISNPNVSSNIKQQIDIINDIKKKCKEEERQNLNELNDYMRNYSHLTFDEYKKIKNNTNEE